MLISVDGEQERQPVHENHCGSHDALLSRNFCCVSLCNADASMDCYRRPASPVAHLDLLGYRHTPGTSHHWVLVDLAQVHDGSERAQLKDAEDLKELSDLPKPPDEVKGSEVLEGI
jgi:hypothetical protein